MNGIQISRQKGFSIIELLVASILIVGISALAFSTLSTSNEVVARNVNSYILADLELEAFEKAEKEAFNQPKSIQLFQAAHGDFDLTAGVITLPMTFKDINDTCTARQINQAQGRINADCPGETGASHDYVNLEQNPLPVYIENSTQLCSIVGITPGNRAFQARTSSGDCLQGLAGGNLKIIIPEYMAIPVLGCPATFENNVVTLSSSPSCHSDSLMTFAQVNTDQLIFSYENNVLAACGIQNSAMNVNGGLELTLDNDCRQRSGGFDFTRTFLPVSNLIPGAGASLGYLFDDFNAPGPSLSP